jgi:hypothetical protein
LRDATVWWVAALCCVIVWALGWSSGFLGPIIHVFLLLAVLAVLASRLGQHGHGQDDGEAAPAGDADTPPLETSAHGAGGDEPARR